MVADSVCKFITFSQINKLFALILILCSYYNSLCENSDYLPENWKSGQAEIIYK